MGNKKYNRDTVPVQRLPLSKKTQEWKETTIDAYISKASNTYINGLSEAEDLRIKYDLYNSKFNIEDLEYVVDPFKVGDSFPASPQNYNIIRPKIDLLIGEESKKPFNMKVIQTDDKGMSKAEETELGLLMRNVMSRISGEQDPNAQTPKQIQDYMKYSYSDIAERTAHYALKYLKEKLNIPNEFLKGWKDGLIAGKEFYYVGIQNGDGFMERVNPIGLSFDKSPDLEFIEDGEWVSRRMLMTPSAVHDDFYDKMTKSDLNKLFELTESNNGGNTGSKVNYDKVIYKTDKDLDNGTDNTEDYLEVYHVAWKSYKRIGFLTYIDENGEEVQDIVDETYKADADEKVEWEWVSETWEGYRVGEDMYFGIEPLADQFDGIDNINKSKLPYYGTLYSDTNSNYTSLIDIMKPLQYMYIIVWYRLELAIARDKGRILNMDITQIPKSFGIDISKWAHYISAIGVNFVNPYEEGWDIPGRAGGAASAFNQISSQDLSMTKVIGDYIALMDKIEQMMGELTGVSKQRQGSISSNELVGNVERSVVQSSHITEPLYWKHNQVKKNVLQRLLDVTKVAWADSSKKYLHFVLDDTARTHIELTKDFTNASLDVFVTDSTREDTNIQKIQSLIGPAISAGASLSEAAEVIVSDNVNEMKNKLAQMDARKQQIEQQNAQSQQETQMAQVQAQKEMKAEENRIKEEDSIRDSETAIQVALIGAESKENSQPEDDGSKDMVEREKLRLQQSKLDEDARKNKAAESLKEKEITIKRKQANKPTSNSNK